MAKKSDKPKPLSQQHRRFVHAYRRLRSAAAAYHEVYPRAIQSTCETEGPRLLRIPQISSEISTLDTEVFKRQQASADQTLAELAHLGFSDMGNLCWAPGETRNGVVLEADNDFVGTLKPLHLLPPEVRRAIKTYKFDILGRPEITLWSKEAMLTNLAKHHKLLTDKVEIDISDDFALMLDAATKRVTNGKKAQ